MVSHHQLRQFGGRFHDQTFDAHLWRFSKVAPHWQYMFRDGAVIALRQREHLISFHIAGNDQCGVVRRIPTVIPNLGIINREHLQVAHPADHWVVIGMFLINRRHHDFMHQRLRLIIGAHAPLFHDYLDFLAEFLRSQIEVLHPIRFQLHRQR